MTYLPKDNLDMSLDRPPSSDMPTFSYPKLPGGDLSCRKYIWS